MSGVKLRERLARAISIHTTDARWSPEGIADAVLDELMTPTEGMYQEGEMELGCHQIFTAMIKAVKEGK